MNQEFLRLLSDLASEYQRTPEMSFHNHEK